MHDPCGRETLRLLRRAAFTAANDQPAHVPIGTLKTDDVRHRSRRGSRWVQDAFAIAAGGCQPYERWVAPEPGRPNNVSATVVQRVAEFARANFSVMDGSFGSSFKPFNSSTRPYNTWEGRVLKQIELAEEFGLKVIPELGDYQYQRDNQASLRRLDIWVSTHGTTAARIFQSPAFWGFKIRDEPPATEFPALRDLSAQIKDSFPGALRFINLLPNYASTSLQMKAVNYTSYVDSYVDTMGSELDLISFDHYPFFERAWTKGKNTTGSPAGYRANLGVVRAASKRANVPFWNFFNVLPFGEHSDPTDAQLSWQVFTSLAYGAKGVIYFCYWSPAGGVPFEKGGGVIYPRGGRTIFKRGSHYDDASRMNSILRVYGNFLLTATSTAVYRVQPNGTHDTGDTGTCRRGEQDCPDGEQPIEDLTLCPMNVANVAVNADWPGAGLLIGQFALANGQIALLLHNQNWDFSIWPTVDFAGTAFEVDPVTGAQADVCDDSPYMPGLQLSFGVAEARLFVLNVTASD
eukprot:COSAG02_NODE_10143_length_2011_cov_14.027014_1_plen_519_part_00